MVLISLLLLRKLVIVSLSTCSSLGKSRDAV